MVTGRSRSWSMVKALAWTGFFGGAAVALLAAVGFVLAVNGAFLGWDDFVHYLRRPRTWSSLGLTAWTASLSTLLSMSVGVPVGYLLARRRVPCPRLVLTLLDLPVFVPPAAVGVLLLGVFRAGPVEHVTSWFGLQVHHAVPGVVVAQVAVTLAFAIRLSKAAFDSVSPRFEAVSRSLGASLPRTFWRVTLPLSRRGLFAGLLVVWARAAAEWESLMLFVGGIPGVTDTLPFAVYLDWNGGLLGWALTNSLLCVLIAAGGLWAVRLLGGRTHVF